MPKTKVEEHTRKLASGANVVVHGHDRDYVGGAHVEGKRSPVESHRRERLKAQARQRRSAAWEQGKQRWQTAKPGIKKRGRQSKKLAKQAGKRLSRAGRYASYHRRTMAAGCVAGALAEVSAGLLWSGGRLSSTTLTLGAAATSGGPLLGGEENQRPRDQPRER